MTRLKISDYYSSVTGKIIVRTSISILVLFLLIWLVSQPVYARHRRVLGVSTESAAPQIPPTAEGPGLILPDSPFFFLDQIKQAARLFLAFNPEAKAKIHNAVAGERLAELRIMLARQNSDGIETALEGISDNLQEAADNLSDAQLSGRDIAEVAREINNDIKRRQESLDILESQTDGELELMVSAAQASILQSKIEVEDGLPDDELENEIRDDLDREVERRVHDATDSAEELEDDLDELENEASKAAQKSLKRREEVLRHAIEQRNEALKKVQKKLLENEKKKHEELLEAQKKSSEQARHAIEKAKEAAEKFQEAQNKIDEINEESSSGSSDSSGTSGSSNTSSGSNSGTSSSGESSGEED